MKRNLLILLIALISLSTHAQHFITDTAYRQKVEQAWKEKMNTVGWKFWQTKGEKPTNEEEEALKFLYAYMPIADITDYTKAYHLNNVRTALRTRKEMPWGNKVPELLFRHFVLPMRVNNEPLDSSRTIFYRELKERVKGLSMKDAILEVNHWCHEKVTYEPSDSRTSSPLQSIRTGRGRCGEESTFTVSALRAIGIPARQVYTPRWAHTDDNHAWVEAWADGKWYFFGACEPEPVLNLGWFNAPASRAMLMHTRAFGDYQGPEEVMLRTNNFTEINLIDNYGSAARVDFKVIDMEGKPVDDAKVEFKIYNYAEFVTAVSKYTDRQGDTFLSAGKGDMIVWASKDGRFGYTKVSFGKDKNVTIQLAYDEKHTPKEQDLDIIPPAENAIIPTVTSAQKAENNKRLAQEDALRNAYIATFPTEESMKNYRFPAAIPYIIKARGNWRTIQTFVEKHEGNIDRALKLLSTLTDKDLRDMPMDILEDNMNATSNEVSPRVEYEMILKPYKKFFAKVFRKDAQKFRNDPSLLVDWVKKNIKLNPDTRAMQIPQTPISVWESRITDDRGRDIFFVDVARSLGIEAQKDLVTWKLQYKKGKDWVDVDFDTSVQEAAKTGKLILDYSPTEYLDDPKYYTHFTISKIVYGRTWIMNFEEGQLDMGGGATWANTFKKGATLDEGTYLLVTGQRMADGSVMAHTQFFTIEPGKTTRQKLDVRQESEGIKVIGSFNSENLIEKDGKEVSILSQTGRGYYVLGVLGMGQEPTNHALHDIAKMKEKLDKWGRPMVLLFTNQAEKDKFEAQKGEFGNLLKNTIFGIDKDGTVVKEIAKEMKLRNPNQLPIFIIADTFNRVVFLSQGYTIGLGEQLVKVSSKL
ncbi:transglutaminase-like domain-containing protein [Prevotella histicola]|mgnify:FL=1|jgi:transglutaminase-related protein|uniref:transglutaminase-like domain-containing protein n=1 Tax=Prevotella histicola TaxID=470565 RepID=UPI001C5F5452|nr:transglutaminase-like domain-containing protein [Prevotella histicola]MBW4711674.1 transglutaminase-like domain-containing protein [Prevotella histicola]MBW4876634.1 transglutaminase-like domain-containing protein [Prevotella histicola]MBW4920259.1 transglutaminase-like domain-containing protein [Prevotella histicola]